VNLIQQLESIARGVSVFDVREFFTRLEIKKTREIMRNYPSHEHADRVQKAIINDGKLAFINNETHQENNPKFIAYALVYSLSNQSEA